MDSHHLSSICSQIYQQYPEVSGITPKVLSKPNSQVQLIFQGKAVTADGRSMPRTVRVTASESGNILKVSTSR